MSGAPLLMDEETRTLVLQVSGEVCWMWGIKHQAALAAVPPITSCDLPTTSCASLVATRVCNKSLLKTYWSPKTTPPLHIQIALKCADLGHLAAEHDVHKRWVLLLEEEMFRWVGHAAQLAAPIAHIHCPCSVCTTYGRCRQHLTIPHTCTHQCIMGIPAHHIRSGNICTLPGSCRQLHCWQPPCVHQTCNDFTCQVTV